MVIEAISLVPLRDSAVFHDADRIGQCEGLVLVVGHQQCGGAMPFEDVTQFERQRLAKIGVEIGKGLIKQQDRG